VLPPERVADAERKRRFVQEAKAASALNHPNIITVHDIASEGGLDFIVMEYVAGQTLSQLISSKGLPPKEAIKYAVHIADALAAAHAKGIIHRDLKPGNVMVTEDGLAKVLDFGLAKLTEPSGPGESTATAVVGTVAYMSPEQAEGIRVDARTDIFSFGAVLYEMLAGRRAFSGLLREEPAPLVDVPPELEKIVTRCLRKNPKDRFQRAADLKQALEESARALDRPVSLPSIAILPFANLSADKENEYFSDGLAEEIINALTKLPGLRVTARTSAFAFRGKEVDISEIGAKLKVGHILEGSVRKAGSRIRVTAQLINVPEGRPQAGASSQARDADMSANRGGHLGMHSTIRDILRHPSFAGFSHLILPWDDRAYDEDMRLTRIGSLLPYHSHVDPETVTSALNRMIDDAASGQTVFYSFYSEAQRQQQPARRNTGLFFFRGRRGAPFAVISPGGGFSYVGSVHEGFPYAEAISRKGYNAFVLRYRTGYGGTVATQDLAAAVTYILRNAGTLGVSTDGYSLWGSSAGARMAAAIGSHGVAKYGGGDAPRPSAIVMAYTAHSDHSSAEPPTFVAVGEQDGIAPPAVMERRVEALRKSGTSVEYHKYKGLGHGFGLGTGTSAEGWVFEAIRFWQQLRTPRQKGPQ